MKQERSGRRRWFEAEDVELIVWLERGHPNDVTGFQLCYNIGTSDYALTWRKGAGFAHNAVDTGDATPLRNETPILLPDGRVPWSEVIRRFTKNSDSLEPWLRQLVSDKLTARAGTDKR